ncbi:MAG: lysophospholipid acyltransferase family protein [Granulosicoccaceae bacterium]|jgi:1-acyl-sn-glycerol-3-phosphate acyltransferase
MSKTRALLRLSRLALHVGNGLTTLFVQRRKYGEKWFDHETGKQAISHWADRFCRIIGVEVQARGQTEHDANLIVANHISWLDVPVLASHLPMCFIAKQEIRHWPVIGGLVSQAGTLFIERESRSILGPLLANMENRFAGQARLALFPEGTTSDGSNVRRFHSALFQACAGKPCMIQPLAIRYCDKDDSHFEAPWINNEKFFPHLWRILQRKQTRVRVDLLPAISTENKGRQELAMMCHMLISTKFPRVEQEVA